MTASAKLIITALVSNGDLGGMCPYSPASKCSSALSRQPSRPPRYDQYEISGLESHHMKDHHPFGLLT